MGFATSRKQALELFNLRRTNPECGGVSHLDIGKAFESVSGIQSWRWDWHRGFDFGAIARSIVDHTRKSKLPTLLSFGAIHRNGKWKCVHMAVALAADARSIKLLDPLGHPPRDQSNANVWLRPLNGDGVVQVVGNTYRINHKNEAAVFRWR